MRVPFLFANPRIRTGRFFQLHEVIHLDWLVDGRISEQDPSFSARICYRGYSRLRAIIC